MAFGAEVAWGSLTWEPQLPVASPADMGVLLSWSQESFCADRYPVKHITPLPSHTGIPRPREGGM